MNTGIRRGLGSSGLLIAPPTNPVSAIPDQITITANGTGAVVINGGPLIAAGASSITVGGSVTIVGGAAISPGTAMIIAGVNSAVNGVTLTNAVTGSGPTIAATGNDTNIALTVQTKGTGNLFLDTGGSGTVNIGTTHASSVQIGQSVTSSVQVQMGATGSFQVYTTGSPKTLFQANGVSSGVNGVLVTQATTTNPPSVAASGSDTNIDLTIAGQGTGIINYGYAGTATGGGSSATLGTIGGSGPATSTQNAWLKIKVNGTAAFIPFWE